MDLTPYVETLRTDLTAVAETAGPEARATADRLLLALEPAVRLAFVEALSHAAAEITGELSGASVDVRMHGREPRFVVDTRVPAAPAPSPPSASELAAEATAESEGEDDATIARITVRIPEPLKVRAEELAARTGISLNSWIVNVVRVATRGGGVEVDIDLPSYPGRGTRAVGRRMTGWV